MQFTPTFARQVFFNTCIVVVSSVASACFPTQPPGMNFVTQPQPGGIPTTGVYAANQGALDVKPIPVVEASEAPVPPGEPGWACFEFQSSRDEFGSKCLRTLASCQDAARQQAVAHGGSTRDPVTFTVSACTTQPEAYCSYTWESPDSGQHTCRRTEKDCSAKVGGMTPAGGPIKQSRCASYP